MFNQVLRTIEYLKQKVIYVFIICKMLPNCWYNQKKKMNLYR